MAYKAKEVAAYIIDYSHTKRYRISNLKLQKLLYFVQANFLVTYDMPCFKDRIEAWDFGPVVPSVYREYKICGRGQIFKDSWTCYNNIEIEDMQLINEIVDICSKYSASDLVDITHQQAPWKNAYVSGKNNEISIKSIKNFFKD